MKYIPVSKMMNSKLMLDSVKCIHVSIKMMNTKLMTDSVSLVKCLPVNRMNTKLMSDSVP